MCALSYLQRSWYHGTPYDAASPSLSPATALSGGPFQSPDRYATSSSTTTRGNWQRTIATSRSILSYVIQVRAWLPREIGAMLWFAPHAAHTSCYLPFPVGTPATAALPLALRDNDLMTMNRGSSFWQAARLVFNVVQLRFADMISEVQAAQQAWEAKARLLQTQVDDEYVRSQNMSAAVAAYVSHATDVIAAWWALSDTLILHYADGTCHACGRSTHNYDDWWLAQVGYSSGPPASPAVPPLTSITDGDDVKL